MNWDSNLSPDVAGWYAVEHCWCIREGIIPGADYWDGGNWRERAERYMLHRSSASFETAEAARKWALENATER